MKKLILILALALLLCSCADAATKIGLDRLNWSQSIDGIKFSGTAPASTTGVLYNDSGTLKFNGASVGGSGSPNEYTTILKIASGSIYEYDGDGNMLDSGSSSTPADVHDIIEHAIGRGGTCLMLAGTYDIGANEINPPTDGSRWVLEGEDRETVIIKGSGTQVFNFASTSGTYRETGCIRNLTIDGSTGTAHGIVIAAKYCRTEIAYRVNIENCVDAISISDSVDLDFTDVRISTCSYGVKILTGCTAINFVRPYIDTITNQGIYLEGEVCGCKFSDGVVEMCGNPAIKFYRTSSGKPSGCVLDSLWIEEDGTNDLILFDGNTGTSGWYGPTGNIIQRCTFHCGSDVNAFVITRGRRNIFSENVCFGSGSNHFTISEGAYSETDLILNCVTTGSGHWVVSDSGTTNVKTNVAEAE